MSKNGEEHYVSETASSEPAALLPASLWKLTLIWGVALFVAFGAWTVVTPLGASPDEPTHMAYAWGVANGQGIFDDPGCETTTFSCSVVIQTPPGLIPYPKCYVFIVTEPATCQQPNTTVVHRVATIRYPPDLLCRCWVWHAAEQSYGSRKSCGRFCGSLNINGDCPFLVGTSFCFSGTSRSAAHSLPIGFAYADGSVYGWIGESQWP